MIVVRDDRDDDDDDTWTEIGEGGVLYIVN
jgi:hypothetical protein